jgi:hypothetical protein
VRVRCDRVIGHRKVSCVGPSTAHLDSRRRRIRRYASPGAGCTFNCRARLGRESFGLTSCRDLARFRRRRYLGIGNSDSDCDFH